MLFRRQNLYPYKRYFHRKRNDQNMPIQQMISEITKEMLKSKSIERKTLLSQLIIALKTRPKQIQGIMHQFQQEESKRTGFSQQDKGFINNQALKIDDKNDIQLKSTANSVFANIQSQLFPSSPIKVIPQNKLEQISQIYVQQVYQSCKKQPEFSRISTESVEVSWNQIGISREIRQKTINNEYQSDYLMTAKRLQDIQQKYYKMKQQFNLKNQALIKLERQTNILQQKFQGLEKDKQLLVAQSNKWKRKCLQLERIVDEAKQQMLHFQKVMTKHMSYNLYFNF